MDYFSRRVGALRLGNTVDSAGSSNARVTFQIPASSPAAAHLHEPIMSSSLSPQHPPHGELASTLPHDEHSPGSAVMKHGLHSCSMCMGKSVSLCNEDEMIKSQAELGVATRAARLRSGGCV